MLKKIIYTLFLAVTMTQISVSKSAAQTISNVVENDAAQAADATAKNYKIKRGAKSLSFEYGISPFHPTNFGGPKPYDVTGRKVQLVNVNFGRVIGTKGPVTYEYFFGATPLAVFSKNEVSNPAYVSATATPNVQPTVRRTTYAVAVQPANFKFIFLPAHRLKVYAQTGAGLLYANQAVPVPYARHFNFTGDFGGGLMYMLTEKRALSFGYKYFHVSTGNIGGKINNPGLNANVFYANYSIFSK